ncbi:MAG: hypothetical protein ABI871_00380 [Chthoniobacterales bacterium]
MKSSTASLLLCLASFSSTIAAAVPAAPTEPIELAIKSSFTMESSGRNPFWPIGWKPVAKAANGGASVGPSISPSAFLVSSITVDPGGRFAIINGKAMQEGQQFGLQIGTQTQELTVKRIEDGRVILGNRDEEIPVPLRRK